ncbi:hypothetical protein SDC9_138868 [bioreactor metagenome]|uniref:Uncharacterized protein n=1 Tax=bioreactor metagenome TaxID=1076179 RepID=A0A645DQJ8_9ZZZZ
MRQNVAIAADADGEVVITQFRVFKANLFFVDDLRAFKKRIDAQNHLVDVDGLDHVVVRPREKTALHVLKCILSGNHEHGHIQRVLAQAFHELKAVHIRHHDVRHDEVDILFFEHVPGVRTVPRFVVDEAVFRKHGAKELA